MDQHLLGRANYHWQEQRRRLRKSQGILGKRRYDAMPIRRAIGISFACLVTSACAIAKAPEKNVSNYPGEAARTAPGNSQIPTAGPRNPACGTVRQGRLNNDYLQGAELWRLSFEPANDLCTGGADPCCGQARVAQSGQFGKAAWYDLIGAKTASGEILDTVTATAAHRSLPLASFARVTDLDNGRSVIVKINDRGPYTRGRVIDLSPRAADALDMKSAGVANVVIEPLRKQATPTLAVLQASDTIIAP
jgi:rare lipoprotein A